MSRIGKFTILFSLMLSFLAACKKDEKTLLQGQKWMGQSIDSVYFNEQNLGICYRSIDFCNAKNCDCYFSDNKEWLPSINGTIFNYYEKCTYKIIATQNANENAISIIRNSTGRTFANGFQRNDTIYLKFICYWRDSTNNNYNSAIEGNYKFTQF